jgi:hypothetical protein
MLRKLTYFFSSFEQDEYTIPEPQLEDMEQQMYFEIIHLQPVKINLSFVKSEGIKLDTGYSNIIPSISRAQH